LSAKSPAEEDLAAKEDGAATDLAAEEVAEEDAAEEEVAEWAQFASPTAGVTVCRLDRLEPRWRDTDGLEISVRRTGLRGNFLR